MWLGRLCARRLVQRHVDVSKRLLSTQTQPLSDQLSRTTRNIGIIAHIDAGKTTTTERMLYYGGYTRRIGDVDEGSTVTDFLPAERARGITIQSAAITFHWPPLSAPPTGSQTASSQPQLPSDFSNTFLSSVPHNINLIDTPGHADFTFEVLRSLRVLDGAVCILDGVAGVEAQTEKVWTQAGHYQIPRIVFVNKLDRVGAAFSRTVKEVGVRLGGWPAVCQIPWWNISKGEGDFVGVGDVVNLRGLKWDAGGDGRSIQAFNFQHLEATDKTFADELEKARTALIELLSEHDDAMVELFLEHNEDHLAIPPLAITQSLRRAILQSPQTIIPIFAGASFRNIGVQPLLDAVVDLLPAPQERPDPEISISNHKSSLATLLTTPPEMSTKSSKGTRRNASSRTKPLSLTELNNLSACALAFKVVNDARRGILVYVRVYSGSIDRGSVLYNTTLSLAERAPRLFKMYANDAVEVDSIQAGQIGVITGLKHARTGDTLIAYRGLQMKGTPPAGLATLQLRPIAIPPPVFFTSIEPQSLSEQKHVQDSLAILLREDPSLQLSVDEESGQTHLAGMGDLHLEIARDRLLGDFKAKARIGKIEIGYRETISSATTDDPLTFTLDKLVAGKQARAAATASVAPVAEESSFPSSIDSNDNKFETSQHSLQDTNTLTITHPPSTSPLLPPHLPLSSLLSAIHAGVSAALARGPAHGFPVSHTAVSIHFDAASHIFPETTPAAVSGAVRAAVLGAVRVGQGGGTGVVLMEPVMRVVLSVPEAALGSVVQDLAAVRGGQVLGLDADSAPDSTSFPSPLSPPSSESSLVINPNAIYTPPEPFSSSSSSSSSTGTTGHQQQQRQITARVPLKEMVGYLNHLRALTGGRGTFVMGVDGFERMGSVRSREVIGGLGRWE